MDGIGLSFTSAMILGISVAVGCVTVDDKGEDDGDSETEDGSGSGSNGAGASGATSGGGSYTCCLNGTGYDCPDDAALDQCIGFDMDGCMSACGFDDVACQDACFDQFESSTPDPSACTQSAAIDCNAGATSGGATSGGSTSGGSTSGEPGCSDELSGCDYDSDCCTGNCADNTCWGNSFGDPCEYDSDCDSGNCYEETCQ
jgi:hypothetical protein